MEEGRKLTMRKPLDPKSLLAAQTTCTRLGSIFTAPSGTSGSVSDNADTNLGASAGASFRRLWAKISSQMKLIPRSCQNSMVSMSDLRV